MSEVPQSFELSSDKLTIDWGYFPHKMEYFATIPRRFKVAYGGRGGAKSWSIARLLITKAMQSTHLILCAREFQASIADSVHALLKSQIQKMRLDAYFEIQETQILCRLTGTKFIFKGLRRNINEIKSTEGITICWVEEAQAVSEASWLILTPTIRAPGSEIWISFNPQDAGDPTYKRFVVNPPPGATLLVNINWDDNCAFPPELDAERRHMQATDPDAYDWVWNGQCRHVSEATIFRGRFKIEEFEAPFGTRFYYGLDFGFSTDPNAALRFWVEEKGGPGLDILRIDYEAYGHQVEIDDLPVFLTGGIAKKNGKQWHGLPEAQNYAIKADSARPETISYLNGQGIFCKPATKWQGCVEDGIEYLKSYAYIAIHPRCTYMQQEARLYSYQVDKRTGDVLPKVEDKHNHLWDALRYGHDGLITKSKGAGIWRRLGQQMPGVIQT